MTTHLSQDDIEQIIKLYQDGTPISTIASCFNVTVYKIYYQLKVNKNLNSHIEHPKSYRDYIHNHLLTLEEKQKTCPEEQKFYFDLEIRRAKLTKKNLRYKV